MLPKPKGIQRRTLLAVLGTALLVFIVFGVASVIYRGSLVKDRVRQLLAPYAEIITVSSDVAVAFENSVRATEILNSLKSNPQILRADLILADGTTLATYPEGGAALEKNYWNRPDEIYFSGNTAELVQTLAPDKDHTATLFIRLSLATFQQRERQTLIELTLFVGLILAVIVLLQFVLLQRWVLSPLTQLTEIAERAGEQGDYTLRAPANDRDEFGQLGRNFNALLAAVQQRETALQRVTNFQRSVLDDAAYAIISTDLTGRITSINPAGERLTGWSAEELVGKFTPEVFHDPAEVEIRAHELSVELGEVIAPGFGVLVVRSQRGLPDEREWTYVRRDGRHVSVLLSVTAQRDERGEIFGFLGNASDITERKATLDALRESESRFRELAESISEVFWIYDLATNRTVYVSPAFERIWGLDRQLVMADPTAWGRTIHPDDFEESKRTFDLVLAGQPPSSREYRIINSTGEVRWIRDRAFPVLDAAGKVVRVVGVVEDNTEQKTSALLAEKSDRRLARIASRVPGMLYEFKLFPDGSTCFPYASDGIREIYRVTPEAVREDATTAFKVIHPDDLARLQESIATSAKNLTQWQCEYRVWFPDGAVRWLLGNSIPEAQADGSVLWHGFITDVSNQKTIEDALKTSNERLALTAKANRVGIWDLNLLNDRLTWDNTMFEVYGRRRRDHFTGDFAAWQQCIHPEDWPTAEKRFQDAFQGLAPLDFDFRTIDDAGGIRHIQTKGVVFHDADHRPVRVLGINFDITASKQFELEVQEKNSLLDGTLQATADGILAVSGEGKIVSYNRQFVELWRVPPELLDLQDATALAQFIEQQINNPNIKIRSLNDTTKSETFDQLEFTDGRVFERFSRPQIVAGRVVGRVWSFRDVTLRHWAVSSLRESEDKFKTLFDTANDAILLLDLTALQDCNHMAETMFGSAREQLLGQSLEHFCPAHQADGRSSEASLHQKISAALAGEPQFFEWICCRADGTPFNVEVSLNPVEIRNRPAVQAILRDITARKQSEAARREAEELYRTLVNTSPDGISVLNLEGNVTFSSPKDLELYGHASLATKLGNSALHFVAEPDRARAQAVLQAAVQGKIEAGQRFVMVRRDGSQFTAEVDGALLRDDLGVPRGIMIITRDISERQRQEDELKNKNAELERFTYTVSHDLKSPLITIKGFANGLLLDLAAGRLERVGDDLKRIVLAADKMSELLNGLLELSRVGRILNPPTAVSMDKVAADVVELLSGSIKQRGAVVTVQPQLPVVSGDPQRLQTVLQNLVENALKFSQPGTAAVIEIGAKTVGAEKCFFVRDAGMGIEPRHQETVFGLFNKLDARSEGTGIGLALVRRIVEFHGGRIWVESPGAQQGTTFYFTLPLRAAKSLSLAEAAS